MAKGQKRSNRETRKPKTATPKAAAAPVRSFLEPIRAAGGNAKAPKGRPRGAG